jgi:hypothetical protein
VQWQDRDINEQDWATFTNFVLSELEGVQPGITKPESSDATTHVPMTVDEFRERSEKIESVVREWNECFFGPRAVSIEPVFSFVEARGPSPAPTYRTFQSAPTGHTHGGHPSRWSPPSEGRNLGYALPQQPPHPSVPSMTAIPSRPRGFPFQGILGPNLNPFESSTSHDMHSRGGPVHHLLGMRGGRGHHAVPKGRHGLHDPYERHERGYGHHLGFSGRGRGSRDMRHRSHSASSTASSTVAVSEHSHHSQEGHHHDGSHHRSSSAHSVSSSSSEESVDSLSSEDIEQADPDMLRQKLANFRIDATQKSQIHLALRELRSEIKAEARNRRRSGLGKENSKEAKAALKSQKKALKKEFRAICKEAKSFKRAERRRIRGEKQHVGSDRVHRSSRCRKGYRPGSAPNNGPDTIPSYSHSTARGVVEEDGVLHDSKHDSHQLEVSRLLAEAEELRDSARQLEVFRARQEAEESAKLSEKAGADKKSSISYHDEQADLSNQINTLERQALECEHRAQALQYNIDPDQGNASATTLVNASDVFVPNIHSATTEALRATSFFKAASQSDRHLSRAAEDRERTRAREEEDRQRRTTRAEEDTQARRAITSAVSEMSAIAMAAAEQDRVLARFEEDRVRRLARADEDRQRRLTRAEEDRQRRLTKAEKERERNLARAERSREQAERNRAQAQRNRDHAGAARAMRNGNGNDSDSTLRAVEGASMLPRGGAAGAGPSRAAAPGFATQIENMGRGIENWGERFGRDMERWGEEFGRRMEERGKAIERGFT